MKNPVGIGRYDQRGNACLDFHLCGVRHDPPGVQYTGIIDTGFTGFIHLPIQYAFSLALPLQGTISVTLANDSQQACLTALAKATLLEKTEVGPVILSVTSNEILIGMDFLRRFKRALVVSQKIGVVLMDEGTFKTDPQ